VSALRRVLRPGGTLVAPTFCHGQTRLSAVISRIGSLFGFPVKRRFTTDSLRAALERAGARIDRIETIPGIIPIGHVEATFP
jgi:hypothetical protein